MALVYCQHCRARIDEDEVFCSECERSLVGDDVGWQRFKLRESIYRTERRSDVYTALATVFVTFGLVGGIILGLLSEPVGLLGIALLFLGVGFGTMARRHDRKADGLRKWLRR